jgi:hypothetical protein
MLSTQDSSPAVWLEIAKLVGPALLAGIGAWIGGKWSVRLETEKIRNERAFDQRLDWYRRAARGIVQMQWFLQDFQKAVLAKDLPKITKLTAQRESEKVALESDQREMVLFASRSTIAALNRANTRASNALKDASEVSGAADAIRELSNAYLVVANDVREHLGMERLTIKDVNSTE